MLKFKQNKFIFSNKKASSLLAVKKRKNKLEKLSLFDLGNKMSDVNSINVLTYKQFY